MGERKKAEGGQRPVEVRNDVAEAQERTKEEVLGHLRAAGDLFSSLSPEGKLAVKRQLEELERVLEVFSSL